MTRCPEHDVKPLSTAPNGATLHFFYLPYAAVLAAAANTVMQSYLGNDNPQTAGATPAHCPNISNVIGTPFRAAV